MPARAAQGVEDFFVSGSNAAAVAFIDRWPDWPFPALALTGPREAGKTHLAHIWRAKAGAVCREAPALCEETVKDIHGRAPLVVENLDHGIGDERALFHILNGARELGQFVLLTAGVAPGELTIALPDLRSRLRALPVAAIEPPDEALVKAVLVKLFADRQLVVEPAVVAYLALHVERRMAAVNRLVVLIDEMSLALRRRVTRPLAASALERLRAREANASGEPPPVLS